MAQKKPASGESTPKKKRRSAKKRAVKKSPQKRAAPDSKKTAPKEPPAQNISPEERHRLIAERAYLIAEQRGFQGDAVLDDWLQAEADIDAGIFCKNSNS